MSLRTFYVLAALLSFTTACGTSAADDGGLPIESFFSEVNKARCQSRLQCHEVESVASCIAAFPTFSAYDIVGAVEHGTTIYDGNVAAACVELRRAPRCDSIRDSKDDACDHVFTGTVADGGDCFVDEECAAAECRQVDTNCDSDTACCPGVCLGTGDNETAAIGASCSELDCAPGAYCNAAKVCNAKIATAGAACNDSQACAAPLDCRAGVCARLPSSGEACTGTFGGCSTIDQYCTSSGFCSSRNLVGERCTSGGDECALYLHCDRSTNTCAERIDPGQACDSNDRCLGLFECKAGTCNPFLTPVPCF